MNTKEVGDKLVSLCAKGKNLEAIDSLYSKNIVSLEPTGGPDMPAEMKGIAKIRGKNQWSYENNEVHSASVEGPFPHKDRFAVKFKFDVTPKAGPQKGKRFQMEEVGLYTVKNGKIVREEFFYSM
ncbi:MAG TPA: nuclear transport factor 2 family protein [Thermoanaerobaculia bacterium]|nr:nuclear transport factor 2 family protein [Thermoanaerobaculia bacterium]